MRQIQVPAILQFLSGRISVAATVLSLSLLGSLLLLAAPPAQALPSFARQTGQQCAACHNGFPELTPYGRLFKLNGYTFGGGQSSLPPVAVMLVPNFTHTQTGQPGGAAPHFDDNNNFSYSASLFYGGAITANIGAFAQATYDDVERRFSWDNVDVRYAKSTSLFGGETIFGAALSNNPTVTDPWNSTPAWGFPFVGSDLAPGPVASTLIEGGLAQQVGGASVYTFINRLVYAELGFYRTLSVRGEKTLGVDTTGTSSNNGIIPYWRFAVEPKWGRHAFEVGTFGMRAEMKPGRISGSGTDNFTDYGIDTQYQFLGERDSLSFQASWIFENQDLTASQALGNSTNTHDRLDSLRAKASYYYQQTYGATLGYFRIHGTSDDGLFSGDSATSSPNSAGFVGELDYMPFSYGGPSFWPWLNMKIGLQYVYYTKFDGGTTNFDGAGRNAHDNNTVFLFAWMAF